MCFQPFQLIIICNCQISIQNFALIRRAEKALNVFPTFSIDIYLQLPIHSKRASNQYSNFALIRRAEICVKVFYNQWSLQDLKGDVFGCS